jgi:ABC-type antimicrobial peptide transport system permease subunit
MTFAIRTALPPLSIVRDVRLAAAEIDAALPVAQVTTQESRIAESLGTERLFAGLVSAFGVVAALLAAIGLYGVMAYSVTRRTAEIGIRMALGARAADVQRLVLRESLLMVALGLLIGLPAAYLVSGTTAKLLYGVRPVDPLSYAAAALAMLAVAGLAAWIPARRAARIDPNIALRTD